MGRYINADSLLEYLRPPDGFGLISLKAMMQSIDSQPTVDVQAFFTEDEIALINEYADEVKAVDFKTAILNAVSVALDKTYWLNVFSDKPTESAPTADTHDRFNEFAKAQDALKPLLARFKGDIL